VLLHRQHHAVGDDLHNYFKFYQINLN
jgi:hypothetical protein